MPSDLVIVRGGAVLRVLIAKYRSFPFEKNSLQVNAKLEIRWASVWRAAKEPFMEHMSSA